jgi:hypothetical protein
MNQTRRGSLPLLLVIAASLLLMPGVLSAQSKGEKKGPVYRQNRGAIVFASQPIQTPGDTKAFAKVVREARREKTLQADAKGNWTFHFIAFLKHAPRADKVNLVWYRSGKKREQVDYTEFVVSPDEVTLQAKATLNRAMFNRGDKLEARVTRLIGRREVVYARCQLELR